MARKVSTRVPVTALAVISLFSACQQTPSLDRKTYPDAVVNLSQVDPVYRPYFAKQNGSNYSLEEQRAAFTKARQTALGPMPAYVESKPKPKTSGKGAKGKSSGKGKATTKGKSTTKGKTATKGKTSASKPSAKGKTSAKPAAKGKSTGKPKTSAKPASKGKTTTKKR